MQNKYWIFIHFGQIYAQNRAFRKNIIFYNNSFRFGVNIFPIVLGPWAAAAITILTNISQKLQS